MGINVIFEKAAEIVNALNAKNTGPVYMGLGAVVAIVYSYYHNSDQVAASEPTPALTSDPSASLEMKPETGDSGQTKAT